MNLLALGQLLQEDGYGTVGKNLFIYNMPAKIESGALLRDRLQGDKIDSELSMIRGGFQLICRARSQEDVRKRARELSAALTMLEIEVSDMKIKYLRPRGEPVVFPVSEGQFIEALVVFDSCYSYIE